MKEEQKVYIKGNQERGDEVIKLLEDLGGYNSYSLDGHNNNNYYFIAPDETINNINVSSLVFSFVKTFYKEIKLQEWKPKNGECYYFIDDRGTIIASMWNKYGERKDNLRYEFGNCFRTTQEAEAVSNKIKELLNNR
jgi:hypothetical protein